MLKAVNSIRKLGSASDFHHKLDFEWPTRAQVLQMKPPFHLSKFAWQEHTCSPDYIFSLGVGLANGLTSEIYSNTPQDKLKAMKIWELTETHQIAKIIVKRQSNSCCVSCIEFYDQDGDLLCAATTRKQGEIAHTYKLNPKERLLGIYGSMTKKAAVHCVGFLVWTPPNI